MGGLGSWGSRPRLYAFAPLGLAAVATCLPGECVGSAEQYASPPASNRLTNLHIVFSTKGRVPLVTEALKDGRLSLRSIPPMPEPNHPVLVGWFFVAAGTLTAALVYGHPEALHAPAWVAYAACATFVLAGLAVVARAEQRGRLHAALLLATLAAFFSVAAWAAFGPGPRDCSVALPFFQGLAADWLCRGAFSFGALFLAVLLVVLIRRLLRGQPVG